MKKMRGKSLIPLLMVLSLLVPLVMVNLGYGAGPPTVFVTPDPATSNPTQYAEVKVNVTDAPEILGYQFKLRWDKKVLGFPAGPPYPGDNTLCNVTEGAFVSSAGSTTFTVIPNFLEAYVHVGCHLDDVVVTPPSGNGTLATFRFLVVESGSTNLTLFDVKLFNYTTGGEVAGVTTDDGYFYTTKPFVDFTWTTNESTRSNSNSTVVNNGTETTGHTNSQASDDVYYQIDPVTIDNQTMIDVEIIYYTTIDTLQTHGLYVVAEGHVENETFGMAPDTFPVDINIYNDAAASWENCFSIADEEDTSYSAMRVLEDRYINGTGAIKLQVSFHGNLTALNVTALDQIMYLDEIYIEFSKLWEFKFDGSACFDPDGGNITQYAWDFGDGNVTVIGDDEPVTPTIRHTYSSYNESGYQVTLTATDDEVDTWSKTKTLAMYHDLTSVNLWPSIYLDYAWWWLDTVDRKIIRGEYVWILGTVVNLGTYAEVFNVTLTAKHLATNTTVPLDCAWGGGPVVEESLGTGTAGGSAWDLMFEWVTDDALPGAWDLILEASNVTGEANTANNILSLSMDILPYGELSESENELISRTLGLSGKINLEDIIVAANAFGATPGDPDWDPLADFDGNDLIDIYDLVFIAIRYGTEWDC
jgi:hypothetical protein